MKLLFIVVLITTPLDSGGLTLQSSDCECTPQFQGTDTDQSGQPTAVSTLADVTGSGTNVSGTVKWVDMESIKGKCLVAGTDCQTENTCIFQANLEVNLTYSPTGQPAPKLARVGGEEWDLTGSIAAGYSGTSGDIRVENLGCGDSGNKTITIIDSDGDAIGTATMTLDCDPCPASQP